MTELTLAASLENIDVVTDFVNEQLEMLDCPMKVQMQIDIAIDELFSNIARYAYTPGVGDATVIFEHQDNPRAVTITFKDCGIPYNPLEEVAPDITLNAEERQIGGLGIFMVKKSMDAIQYSYCDRQNILTIQKNY